MTKNELQQSLKDFISGKRVYFLWSGGDDSNLLMKIILDFNLYKECNLTVVTVPFPQHVYSEMKIEKCTHYLSELGIDFKLLYTKKEISQDINYTDTCPTCKIIRREKFLEYYLPQKKDGDTILTGHNLSDLMSYYVEQCIIQLELHNISSSNRFLEISNKFLRTYDAGNGLYIHRPLLDFSENEIHSFFIENVHSQIQILSQKCIWSAQRKRLLQEYFVKANIISSFGHVKNLFEKNFGIPSLDEFRNISFETYLV